MNFNAPVVSLSFGVLLLVLYTLMLLAPTKAFNLLRRYPRTVWPGRILIAVSVAWFAYNLNLVDLGGFNYLKKSLWVLGPVAFYLIVKFIPDLLSVRGFCTFCLLAGKSVLIAVRWQEGPASIAVGLLVYAVMVKCMFLVVYPHFWIRGINGLEARPQWQKPLFLAGMGVGIGLIVCGILSW